MANAIRRSACILRSLPAEGKFMVSLKINDKSVNMSRAMDEDISSFKNRFTLNVAKSFIATKKEKAPELTVVFNPDIEASDAWSFAKNLQSISISVPAKEFKMEMPALVDPSELKSMEIMVPIMENQVILANVTFERCSYDDIEVTWAASDKPDVILHRGFFFRPGSELVGKHLIATASISSAQSEYEGQSIKITTNTIAPLRLQDWVRDRVSEFSVSKSNDGIKICSYNILAPALARTPLALNAMYPYCKGNYSLDPYRRVALLMAELDDLNCDLYGLQEVSSLWFEKYLAPFFRAKGFEGILKVKPSNSMEGPAIFWRKSKFEAVPIAEGLRGDAPFAISTIEGGINGADSSSVAAAVSCQSFRRYFITSPACEEVRNEIAKRWPYFLVDVLPRLSTVIQSVNLRHIETNREVVVGNTHMFFHPHASHVRMIQVHAMCHMLANLSANGRLPVIMLGDFNASPDSGAAQLLRGLSSIDETHNSWWRAREFTWGSGRVYMKAAAGTITNTATPVVAVAAAEDANDTPATVDEDDVEPDQDGTEAGAEGEDGKSDGSTPSKRAKKISPAKEEENFVREAAEALMQRFAADHAAFAAANPVYESDENKPVFWGMPLTHPLESVNADVYEMVGATAEMTTCVNGFCDRLDWVIVDKTRFETLQVLPVPSQETVSPGLPSMSYASDHVAIAGEIRWRD